MLALPAWLVRIRGAGWFLPSRTGALFPMPFLWQGWALFGGLLAVLTASVLIHGEVAWVARIALCAAYLGVAYWTTDPDIP